jgi:hypothetical protein
MARETIEILLFLAMDPHEEVVPGSPGKSQKNQEEPGGARRNQ